MTLPRGKRIQVWLVLVAVIIAGLVLAYLIFGRLQGRLIYGIETREKVVALTYDDGPHPIYTPQILRILAQYHIKATFFMIGSRMEQYPDIVRMVAAQGHVIGSHTYTHPSNFEDLPPKALRQELEQCDRVITNFTGKQPEYFRPPLGYVNNAVLHAAKLKGYHTVLWTVSADHHDAPTPALMAKRVMQRIQPGGIILAHDGSFDSRWKDVAATPLIIDALLKKGYRFVTVPELLALEAKSHKQ